MSPDDSTSTYAPKSPDLSSFYSSGGPTQPASQLHPPSQGPGQYKLHPPAYAYGSSYTPPPMPQASTSVPQQHIKSEFSSYSPPLQQQYSPPGLNPNNLAPPNISQNSYSLQPPVFQQQYPDQLYRGHIPQQPGLQFQQEYPLKASPESPGASTQANSEMPPRRAAAQPPPPPAIEPSPVKTKFPTARIKRIMQADEEVGKVAQQTPIAVGKALELFMIQLVTKSAEVAKDKGSKRVTAPMLKHVVETDDQWDFLREIVGRVENEKEGSKSKAKAESDSDEDSEPKKRGRGGGRKKKV
ncbi:histone-fold domain-containing protein [Pochonia chlamydosporia 170]|uniref:NCT transcriptional regulatory complex subunit A n=1 Tax=Pochonia chlamydosporia 170 TaxID=1380566 RepID=A0A179FRX8_METCM|nr:histone-fold domain-containing protein [Pochonia chlamydosporia 170]OAQ68008.1 histone-fold domain-containing protein [Pochonia chlamydosporia 170]